jgi:hypothetical protein
MRRGTLLAAASAALVLGSAAPALSRPETTNPGAFETIRVTLTDSSITVKPKVSGRGVTGIFVLTNRGTKRHTWVIGDIKRGAGKNIGFTRTLRPGQQQSVVMFLNYRGVLPYYSPDTGKTRIKGIFTIK